MVSKIQLVVYRAHARASSRIQLVVDSALNQGTLEKTGVELTDKQKENSDPPNSYASTSDEEKPTTETKNADRFFAPTKSRYEKRNEN